MNPSRDPRSARPPHFRQRVYHVVRQVPAGRVTSYGDVAAVAGSPRAARGVGAALNALGPEDDDVPWWRVVNRSGRLSIPAVLGRRVLQRTLLEREGIVFSEGGRIDLDRFGWEGPERDTP